MDAVAEKGPADRFARRHPQLEVELWHAGQQGVAAQHEALHDEGGGAQHESPAQSSGSDMPTWL